MSDSFLGMTLQLILHNGRTVEKSLSRHVSPERLAAFLDGSLGPDARRTATLHFADCATCRHELAELRSVLDSSRGSRRTRLAVWLALAASIGFVITIPSVLRDERSAGNGPVGIERERSADSIAPALIIQEPPDEAVVSAPVKLSWHSTAVNGAYRVVVTDSSGGPVFRLDLAEMSLVLPDSTRLISRGRYYWSVHARFADGRSASTPQQAFTMQ